MPAKAGAPSVCVFNHPHNIPSVGATRLVAHFLHPQELSIAHRAKHRFAPTIARNYTQWFEEVHRKLDYRTSTILFTSTTPPALSW